MLTLDQIENAWDTLLPFLTPIVTQIRDEQISEICINADGSIYVERNGAFDRTPIIFPVDLLQHAATRIVRSRGADIHDLNPRWEGRLPDGSRIAIVVPPASPAGTVMTIRKFQYRRLSIVALVANGMLTQEQADILMAAVIAQRNILIAGGTGTGKTTLVNALTAAIPPEQRIVVIEDVNELKIDQPNVVYLQAHEKEPEVTLADLVKTSMRLRPDRIIIGEVRGAEAYDMLDALNTGHSGMLTSIHSDSAADAINRLMLCVLKRGTQLDVDWIRLLIHSSIHVIAHVARFQGFRFVREMIAIAGGIARPLCDVR